MKFGFDISRKGFSFEISRDGQRNFAAAKPSNKTYFWRGVKNHINRILRYDLPELVAKSREQAQNNPYLKGYLGFAEENIAGPEGFRFQSKIKGKDGKFDEKLNNEVEQAYNEWCKREYCTIHKSYSMTELEWMLPKLAKRDGEFLLRMHTGPDVNDFGFAFELFEWEDLDITMNEVLSNGNVVIMGKEYNRNKEVVNYYIKEYPFATAYNNNKAYFERIPYPAAEMIHFYDRDHPRQARGIPEAAAVLITAYKMDDFEDSSLDNARVSAKKMGFIQKDATKMLRNGAGSGGGFVNGNAEEEAGDEVFEMESSVYVKLDEGESFQGFAPNFPSEQHEPFMKSLGRRYAAGVKASFNKLFRNLESVNYNSLRSDELTDQRHWITEQNKMIEGFHRVFYPVWFRMAVLSGKIKGVPYTKWREYAVGFWQGTRWMWVDPLKEVRATVEALDNNLTTLTDELANKGKDFNDVMSRRKQELAELIELAKLQNEYDQLTGKKGKEKVEVPEEEEEENSTENKKKVA